MSVISVEAADGKWRPSNDCMEQSTCKLSKGYQDSTIRTARPTPEECNNLQAGRNNLSVARPPIHNQFRSFWRLLALVSAESLVHARY